MREACEVREALDVCEVRQAPDVRDMREAPDVRDMREVRPNRSPAGRRRPLRQWAHSQRRAAAGHFVRGLCYGAGLLTASLAGLWVQQYL
uniref:Uncharacterized protein n=1 Tax=Streptomyces sp. NBC_01401 TaxID=2903854 RepID=A0AAU3GTB2_9ACTN